MRNLIGDYTAALKEARELPTHYNGELQERHKFFGVNKYYSKIIYCDNLTPVNVFESLNIRYRTATRYYVKIVPTYRENGNLKKMIDWDKKLMYHKAWGRTDIEVNIVSFNIIGIKRKTSHLSAGVLISNINFK